jgi:hypothetical protein
VGVFWADVVQKRLCYVFCANVTRVKKVCNITKLLIRKGKEDNVAMLLMLKEMYTPWGTFFMLGGMRHAAPRLAPPDLIFEKSRNI